MVILLIVIAIMILGIGGLLYLNGSLSAKKPLVLDSADKFQDYLPIETSASSSAASLKTTKPAAAASAKSKSGLDLTIFSDENFKNLTDTLSTAKTKPDTGKRDPFKSN